MVVVMVCVSFTRYNWLTPLPLVTFCLLSMSPHPLRCIQVHSLPHSNLVPSTSFCYKRKAKKRPWTSTGSRLCLVSKAKDKNKIKTYERSADSDISLKCILYWQTRKGECNCYQPKQKMRTGEENCLASYSRRLRNQNGEHLKNPYESIILEIQGIFPI